MNDVKKYKCQLHSNYCSSKFFFLKNLQILKIYEIQISSLWPKIFCDLYLQWGVVAANHSISIIKNMLDI